MGKRETASANRTKQKERNVGMVQRIHGCDGVRWKEKLHRKLWIGWREREMEASDWQCHVGQRQKINRNGWQAAVARDKNRPQKFAIAGNVSTHAQRRTLFLLFAVAESEMPHFNVPRIAMIFSVIIECKTFNRSICHIRLERKQMRIESLFA